MGTIAGTRVLCTQYPARVTIAYHNVTGLKCIQVIYAIVSRTIRLPTPKGAKFVDNTVVLTIVSLKYTVPVAYSALLSILTVPYLHAC